MGRGAARSFLKGNGRLPKTNFVISKFFKDQYIPNP